jgi:hypothetical protein
MRLSGFFQMITAEQPRWSNVVALVAKNQFAALADVDDAKQAFAAAPMTEEFIDPWYGRSLSAFRVAYLAQNGRWSDAYARLSKMPASSANLTLWNEMELLLRQLDDLGTDGHLAVL